MDAIIKALTSLTPLVALLVSTGLVVKYLPFLAKIPNQIIPLLNALITFLMAFGPAPANAGIFGDIAHTISFPVKAIGSIAISAMASSIYEVYLRPWLEKMGVYGAGTTKAQAAVRDKAAVVS